MKCNLHQSAQVSPVHALAMLPQLAFLAVALLISSSLSAEVEWSHLPSLPDDKGLGGPFAGVTGDVLVVAGGANFPTGTPWTGGIKVWHDDVFVLTSPDGQWRRISSGLPQPLAYGASVTWRDQLICIGGGDSERHYEQVFAMVWNGNTIEIQTTLPPLPQPAAFLSAVLIGDTIYVAGGSSEPDSTEALHTFYALDLSKPVSVQQWEQLEPWPGPERILPVVGTKDSAFYLFSGARLTRNSDGSVGREYLKDAYCYRPGSGWSKIADLPRAAVAAPNPAVVLGAGYLAILGGDSGVHFNELASYQQHYPDFSNEILTYHPTTDTWAVQGQMPSEETPEQTADPQTSVLPPVTTATVWWREHVVIPSGEIRPSIRTTRVLWGNPQMNK